MNSEWSVLRSPFTSLIGRDVEVERILALVGEPGIRLITLTGPGGVGKTRLALRVAELAESNELMQVEIVDLSAVEDPSAMAAQIARSFDIWQLARATPLDRIAAEIGNRPFLLVLDNLDQISSGASELLVLFDRCPHLTILATSRIPLNLSAEQRVPVSTLPLTRAGAVFTAGEFEAGSAVELFVARARLADPNFQLFEHNIPDVVEVCRQLDGLPLAIELAAARVRELPPQILVAHLENTLPLLVGGPRDRPHRQRTMRDTISWSYRLLQESEKELFRALSVFRGPFSFDSVLSLLSRDANVKIAHRSELIELLGTLLNDNLLVLEDDLRSGLRYRMLSTVREFGFEQLALKDDEESRVRKAHAQLILDSIALEIPGTYGLTTVAWLRLVDAYRADLDAALAWSFEHGEALVGIELAVTASAYWFNLGRATESLRWLPVASRTAANLHQSVPPDRQAILMVETILAASMSGQFALAHAIAESPDLHTLAELCNPHIQISAMTARSMLADFRRDFEHSLSLAEQAAELARCNPLAPALPWALTRLGWELLTLGHHDQPRDLLDEAYAIFAARGDSLDEAILSGVLAQIYLTEGNLKRASDLLVRCFSLQLDLWDPWGAVSDVASAAQMALAVDEPQLSARLLGACAAGDVQNRIAQQPFVSGLIEKVTEQTRIRLGSDEFERCFVEGAQSSLPEALELCLEVARRAAGTTPIDNADGELTSREREVLKQICSGKTDRQIAELLFVSRRTVNTHVTHILDKLGVQSRSEAAAEAVRRNIV